MVKIESTLTVEFDQALQIVLAGPIEDLERIARRYFSPPALRRARLERRDEAIRRLGAELLGRGRARTGCELADTIAKLLRRADAAASASPALAEILALAHGQYPSRLHLRRILAGLAQKNARQCAADAAISNA
jgi:hypothetical protein